MSIENKQIGVRIRRVRNEKKLKQCQLANKAHLSASFLSYVESGKKGITVEAFIDICNALEVSADYILADALVANEATLQKEVDGILKGCSETERVIIYDVVKAVKRSLRERRNILAEEYLKRYHPYRDL